MPRLDGRVSQPIMLRFRLINRLLQPLVDNDPVDPIPFFIMRVESVHRQEFRAINLVGK